MPVGGSLGYASKDAGLPSDVGGVGVGFLGWLTCVCDRRAVALMSRRGKLSIISPLRLWTEPAR